MASECGAFAECEYGFLYDDARKLMERLAQQILHRLEGRGDPLTPNRWQPVIVIVDADEGGVDGMAFEVHVQEAVDPGRVRGDSVIGHERKMARTRDSATVGRVWHAGLGTPIVGVQTGRRPAFLSVLGVGMCL